MHYNTANALLGKIRVIQTDMREVRDRMENYDDTQGAAHCVQQAEQMLETAIKELLKLEHTR